MNHLYHYLGGNDYCVFWAFLLIVFVLLGALALEWVTKRTGYPYSFYEWHFKRRKLALRYIHWFKDPKSKLNVWAWDFGQYCKHCRNALSLRPRRYQKLWWPWACTIYMENRCPKVAGWSNNWPEQNLVYAENQLRNS